MPNETPDRDAIVSKATAIASEKERNAYIAQACDNNAELKHEVEERVAEHFQARNQEEPAHAADAGPPPLEQARANHTEGRESLREMARKHPRALTVATVTFVLLLAVAVAGAGLAVWALRKEKQASKAEQEAVQKQEQAQKNDEATKGKLHQSEAARQAVERERDRAKAAAKEAQQSEEDTKAILAFVRDKLLAAGRPNDVSITEEFWAKGQSKDKDITLRKAVETAESQVADLFADRPLREASVREMLGLAYLNLGQPAQAVKQYERALALREAMQGASHPDTADCRNKLAVAYRLAGRTTEAGRLFDQNLNAPAHATGLAVRGSILLSEKKPAEAELKLRACLTIREKLQPDDWTTFDAKSMLGEALLDQKRYAEAEPLLLSGYEGMKQREDTIPPQDRHRLTSALQRLVHLYEAWGKQDKAAQWQKEMKTAKKT